MAVRSKRLFGPVDVGTAGSLVYTSPAGETTLLKQLEFGVGTLGGSSVTFYLGTITASNRMHIKVLGSSDWSSEPGLFLVLQPGEELRVQTSSGTVTVSGFGAQLEGVAD